MNKIIALTIGIFLWGVTYSLGQFINIQIEIEPEVDAVVEQTLDFGPLITNSGLREINLGSPNMGIFKVSALRTQRLLISLNAPEHLQHMTLSQTTVPINISGAYTNFGVNDVSQSMPITQTLQDIVIEGHPNSPQSVWSSLYIYIFGDITVGNVPAGMYHGEITLTVVYE